MPAIIRSPTGELLNKKNIKQIPPQPATNSSYLRDIAESIPGIAARGLESAGGLYGTASGYAEKALENIAELPLKPFQKILPENVGIKKNIQQKLFEKSGEELEVTPEFIRKNVTQPIAEKAGVSLEPKGPISEYAQGAAENIGALVMPFIGPGMKIGTAIGTGLAGETTKSIVKGLGGGPIAQAIGNFAGMFGYGLAGTRRNLIKEAEEGFDAVKKFATEIPNANPAPLEHNLQRGLNHIKGRDLPKATKDFLIERYETALNKVKPAETIEAKELLKKPTKTTVFETGRPTTKVSEAGIIIPEEISKTGRNIAQEAKTRPLRYTQEGKIAFPERLTMSDAVDSLRDINGWWPHMPAGAEPYMKQLNGIFSDFIEKNGSPEMRKAFNTSNEIWSGIKAGGSIGNFIRETIPSATIKSDTARAVINGFGATAGGVLAYGTLGLVGGLPGVAVGTGAGVLGRQAYKTWKLLQTSPIAKQRYINIAKHAAQQDAKALIKEIKLFDKDVEAFEKKNPNWEQKPVRIAKGVSIRPPNQSIR